MDKSPDAFRTISEVAEWLDTPAHVFRFWESRFSQIKPVKRAGGRRYYRPTDMLLLGGIKKLLHDGGMTIKGVQKILREKGVKHVQSLSQPVSLQVSIKKKSKAATKTAKVKEPATRTSAPEITPVAEEPPLRVDLPRVSIKPKQSVSDAAVAAPDIKDESIEAEEQDMFDLPLIASDDEASLTVIEFSQSLKTVSDISLKDMEDIEALYYSLKMVRNNMMRSGAGR
jgi:DNA-binding transcriptional MerR regulator